MKLHIGQGFSLPIDFTTQTQAILAIKRVGKSYTASVQAEELLKAGQQIVAIDVTGAWWGLRSNAAGNGPGFPILIAGGDHGDIPLEENAGEVLAEAIVSERFSAIIDVSLFRKGAAQRFLAVFFETLYRKNREAMHLFMDEADFYAPQKPFGEEARVLGAVNDIVRRGGIRGIGSTLITQRASVLNKDVLTQCGMLTCLRIIHPRDMSAIKEWVDVHGDPELAKEMIRTLPSLPKGEAWVWAPGWPTEEGLFQRTRIRTRETFDSGATPKAGQVAKAPKVIAQVDIAKLGQQISATAQRVKENDPKELKKRIGELERQVKASPSVSKEVKVVDDAAIQRAVEKAVAQRDRENRTQLAGYQAVIEKLQNALANVGKIASQFVSIELPKESHAPVTVELPPRRVVQAPTMRPVQRTTTPVHEGGKLKSGAERLLAALVQWYPEGMTEGQMRAQAGLKKSGTYDSYKSSMRVRGLFEERGGLLFATQAAVDYFGGDVPEAPSTTEDVLKVWKPKLKSGACRMLDVLIEHGALTRDELAERSGFSRSGTFDSYLSSLRTARLIVSSSEVVEPNKETLFL